MVWVSDFGANAMARFDPEHETFEVFPLPSADANVRQILGRSGEVWRLDISIYIAGLANQTYLQLETLVTHISHRFRLEDSEYPFVYTNLIVINAKTVKTS